MAVDAAKAVRELQETLGDSVLLDAATRSSRGHDRSHHPWEMPEAVVACNSTHDVSRAMAICHRNRIPVVPVGAGTGLEGGANSRAGSVCLDLSPMTEILHLGVQDLNATVQAGVLKSALNNAALPHGLCFPAGPGVDASMGGMASTRASGTKAVAYGTMRENVLGLRVVLADGTVANTGGLARKSAAGYDLTGLFVGAEGTLGIITEVCVRLYGIPESTEMALVPYPTLGSAVQSVSAAIAAGIAFARVELLDDVMVGAMNSYSGVALTVAPTLMVEFEGGPAAVQESVRRFGRIAAVHGALGYEFSPDPERRDTLWRARTDVLPACAALRQGAVTWSTDVCVPISRLAECIEQTQADIAASNILAPIAGHVGDGNFHLAFVLDPDSAAEHAEAAAVNERLVNRALRMGGTCTGEHGIGAGKREALRIEHADSLPIMKSIKAALDPRMLLNPGKVL
ncbi:FAD-binding oxidoreductase [Arthrobacter sp. STN4]|uniref:FAD-binding oxidoreductase n=1 Tax=Arthrobacter sp. STN4 TaxID=2923276 RepID=UPI00211A288A|nr:FAD-linked oxidase C-terminal domain-containing protein [Arthrobacter sp. STN4]MCQ9165969.1 FAD-binding protein [Arthrobacter sp. STN4]